MVNPTQTGIQNFGEKTKSYNNRLRGCTNSQNVTTVSDISSLSGTLPSDTTINSQAHLMDLPDPPTHEPGEKSKKKVKGKGVKEKVTNFKKKLFSKSS